MEIFLKGFQSDPLAVVVLALLIITMIVSTILMTAGKPIPVTKSWHIGLLAIFALIELPAAIDLLRNGGMTMIYVLVIIGIMLLNIVVPILNFANKSSSCGFVVNWEKWVIPFLIAGGIVISGYLFFVETTSGIPACGVTINGCATVQTSSYAKLFGVLPVAALGLIGYLAILTAWLIGLFNTKKIARISHLAIWLLSIFGVFFSIYLTYLEPFVIHATCSWCISSAVIMMMLLWVTTPPAQRALIK